MLTKIKAESAYISGLTLFFVIEKIATGRVWKPGPLVK